MGISLLSGLSSTTVGVRPNNRLLSPRWGWDGLSAAARLQVRPKAGRWTA